MYHYCAQYITTVREANGGSGTNRRLSSILKMLTSSFRLIVNLSFISKSAERVVTAYRQFQSTEIAACIVHNDLELVRAIDKYHVTVRYFY